MVTAFTEMPGMGNPPVGCGGSATMKAYSVVSRQPPAPSTAQWWRLTRLDPPSIRALSRVARRGRRTTRTGGPMPESIPAPLIIDTLKDTFREARAALAAEVQEPPRHQHLGWILSVPDTHQKSVLAALDKEQALRVLTCATEDEATAVAAGLWIGGEPGALTSQPPGLHASVNALRGVAMDGRVPIFYMIGLLSRERDKDPRESRHSMVRYAEPLLDTFGVPHGRLEGPGDVHLIPED